MIPLKIQLKNFLSYGPELQTIDFEPYPLICLSGRNGHGKSALLDAITWALWGQARKTFGVAKADEGLIRLGQTQMMVVLDFSFNNQVYRVRREFAKTYGKPYAVLEFGLLNQETDTLIPLTDKTIRQTQEKIEQLLNLDGESFCNSAFLRQGQANEFSKKSAKERKTVLATILGLNRYDAVRTLAMNKTREASLQKQQLLLEQTKHQQSIESKQALEAKIIDCTAQLKNITQQEQQLALHMTAVEEQKKNYAQNMQEAQLVQFQKNQLMQEQTEKIDLLRANRAQWQATHRTLLSVSNQEQLETQRRTLLNDLNAHQTKLQKGLELKEQFLHTKEAAALLEKKLSEAATATLQAKKLHIERLHLEKKATQTKIAEIIQQQKVTQSEQQACKRTLQNIRTKLEALHTQQKHTQAIEQQFERRKEYYQQFITQGTWTKQELENLQQKKAMAHDDNNPSCPLCEQNLSATRKKFLKNRFENDEQFLTHRLRRLKKVSTHLKALLIDQHTQLASFKQIAQESALLKAQEQETKKNLEKLALQIAQEATAHDQLVTILAQHEHIIITEQQQLATLTAQGQTDLLNDDEYQKLCTQLKNLELAMKELVYDAQAHQKAQKELLDLEQKLAHYAQAAQQASLQEQRKQIIVTLCLQLKANKTAQKELLLKAQQYTHLPETLKKIVALEQDLATQNSVLRTHKELLLQEKGKLEHEQTLLAQIEQEYAKSKQAITLLDTTIDDYQIIATATSKDGIQALLIEEAIPEIEHEANELLAKLTNNQAQIFIESLRDLKKGGTKETLDIKISDSIGIRPYEMFSGGEAFRIDFALRIAISKLLARRAGTSLQTLIIDEGFGSQDEEGLNHIMDALYKIQDDFAKIIIVSHLPFMKDQFPVHFIVDKGPNGSAVKVIEQG